MSSRFSGGYPDIFNTNGGNGVSNVTERSISMMNVNGVSRSNYNQQVNYRSPLLPVVRPRSDLIGKRSLLEFQLQQQQSPVYLRNVKPRVYNHQQSDLLLSPEVSSITNFSSSEKRSLLEFQQQQQQPPVYFRNVKPRVYNHQQSDLLVSPEVSSISNFSSSTPDVNKFNCRKQAPVSHETEMNMMNRLRELEKELLDDEENENDAVSVVTDNQLSGSIQILIKKPVNMISPSPTTSSTSSCASSSTTVSAKQLVADAAEAITDGKLETAMDLITRLNQFSNARGTPEQRLGFFMASALRARLRVNSTAEEQPSSATELYKKEHILSTQLLYDKSPVFKLAFMAANNLILQTVLESDQQERNIHVVDFDIGHALQYAFMLNEIATARKVTREVQISLKLTTFKNFGNGGDERLKLVGDGLKSLANKLGVEFHYNVLDFKLSEITKQGLEVAAGEILAVNFAFKLNKLPDESVTTENLRDEVLRRVKGMSPAVVTVAEQELNTNTAAFAARVNDVFSHYVALLDSFDTKVPKDNSERVKIEDGLSRRIMNSVACEGRDRVERCEVFGKWRVRMRMAGFELNPVSQATAETLMSKVNAGTRGNPGFSVKEELGGVSFGWLGKSLTTVSAWH